MSLTVVGGHRQDQIAIPTLKYIYNYIRGVGKGGKEGNCPPPHFLRRGGIAPPFLPEMTTSCHQQILCILHFTGQMAISNFLPPNLFSACYMPLCIIYVYIYKSTWGCMWPAMYLYITHALYFDIYTTPLEGIQLMSIAGYEAYVFVCFMYKTLCATLHMAAVGRPYSPVCVFILQEKLFNTYNNYFILTI